MQITDNKPYAVELESSEEYLELEEQHFGLCLACGNDQYNCEPDAAGYICDNCNQRKVYGTVNLLMMDKFIFP
jgi:hypothetical protein